MRINYRRVNNVLLVLIILINAYTISAPFLPKVQWWWQSQHSQAHQQLVQQAKRAPTKHVANHVVIPDMLLNKPIYDGPVADTYKILHKGIWRWPTTSQPGQPGNTVLIGHRFTYTQPKGVFYYLDKVHVGSTITIFWNDKKYIYKVATVKVVPNTDISIEQQTKDTRLTIYTCTPLWHPVNRLVVIAKPEVAHG